LLDRLEISYRERTESLRLEQRWLDTDKGEESGEQHPIEYRAALDAS
jgi:hypothetical protein